MILQKQVVSSIIEFRVSDTVQEFKRFNKSLFLHVLCVINHMAALWEFISVSITNTHSKSLINDCCLLNLTVNQLQQSCSRMSYLQTPMWASGTSFLKSMLIGPGHVKICLMPYANNKGTDQPVHPCSLISTFVVRCLDSMICILALSKVLRF